MLNPALNNDNKHWLRRERFTLYTAEDFLRKPDQVRNAVGVYVILIRHAQDLLLRCRLPVSGNLARWSVLDYQHVYTGLSAAMRSRVILHLCGTARDSAVRENLLALQYSDQILWADCYMPTWEDGLTAWLTQNAVVGFQVNDEPHVTEQALIERLPSPFNTIHKERDAFVTAITERREQYRQHLRAAGQVQPRAPASSASQWLVREAENHLFGWQSKHLTQPRS